MKEILLDTQKILLKADYKDKLRTDTELEEPVIKVVSDILEKCIDNYTKQREEEKYYVVKKEIPFFVGCRFKNLKQLNGMLTKMCNITVEESWDNEENTTSGSDYLLVGSINEDWGYVDINYILDNNKNIFITEVNIGEE